MVWRHPRARRGLVCELTFARRPTPQRPVPPRTCATRRARRLPLPWRQLARYVIALCTRIERAGACPDE
eukprot:2973548-Alexandrium_andersonii.AAC.1